MEKYGEIPPRFTKAWWSYFWYYYKWRVLITVGALIIAAFTIVQCVNRPRYDMTIVYAGHRTYGEKEQERLCALAEGYIPDADGNGKVKVFYQPLVFSDGAGNESFDYAVQTKLDLSFVDEDAYIYLMDEIEARLYMQREGISDAFESVDVYAKDTAKDVLRGKDKTGYAVRLKDSAILKANNINDDDLFLIVRKNSKDAEKNIKAHEGAVNFAKALVE